MHQPLLLQTGFKTKKEANRMRDEELILIGMKEAPLRAVDDDPIARQAKVRLTLHGNALLHRR